MSRKGINSFERAILFQYITRRVMKFSLTSTALIKELAADCLLTLKDFLPPNLMDQQMAGKNQLRDIK